MNTVIERRMAAARAVEYDFADGRVFLNAASYGPLPERARAAVERYERRRNRAQLQPDDFTSSLVAVRAAVARLIGATPNEIALTPNTNTGINLAASLLLQRGVRDGRNTIVVSEAEFPANVYPWIALERFGFQVRLIPLTPQGTPDEERLAAEIERPEVTALALSLVQFATGYRADLHALGELCRRHGVFLAVDAIQAIGAVPLDLGTTHVDVLSTGGQKWLCSPYATGFAYVRSSLLKESVPLLPGWLSFAGSSDYSRLVDYRYDLVDDARRFEVGTLAYQAFAGMLPSLELLLELGVSNICTHVRALQDQIIEFCRGRGIQVSSDVQETRRSGILCIRPRDADRVFALLTDRGITCALREGAVRISPHFYNAPEDLDPLFRVLDEAVA